MGEPSIYRGAGMLIVACFFVLYSPSAKESHPRAAREMTRVPPVAEPLKIAKLAAPPPNMSGMMLLRFADMSRNFGEYSTAETIVKDLLSPMEISLQSADAETAVGLAKLALLCVDQGKYGEAELYFQRVLTIIDNRAGSGSVDNLPPPDGQLSAQSSDELYSLADLVYQRLLAFLTRRFGHEEPIVAVVLRDIAELHRRQGKLADAAAYYDYALAILRANLGADHPEYGFTEESYISMQSELDCLVLNHS